MSKSKDDYKNEIVQNIIPATQSILNDILGTKVEIDVQWESLDKVTNVTRAYEALATWKG